MDVLSFMEFLEALGKFLSRYSYKYCFCTLLSSPFKSPIICMLLMSIDLLFFICIFILFFPSEYQSSYLIFTDQLPSFTVPICLQESSTEFLFFQLYFSVLQISFYSFLIDVSTLVKLSISFFFSVRILIIIILMSVLFNSNICIASQFIFIAWFSVIEFCFVSCTVLLNDVCCL